MRARKDKKVAQLCRSREVYATMTMWRVLEVPSTLRTRFWRHQLHYSLAARLYLYA